MGKKSSPAPAAPAPTFTQVEQKPTEPIQRAATNAEARDRAASNPGAELLGGAASPEDEAARRSQASMMG